MPRLLHAAAPVVIGCAWALVIRQVHLSAMTDLGLVSVLPLASILLLFLLTVSFSLAVAERPLSEFVLLVHVVVLIVLLYGITRFVEPVPRFGAAYGFVGIIDQIASHGSINPNIDAFFDWPGFVSFGALLMKVAGLRTTMGILGWAPVVFNLLFLPPLIMIFRWAADDPRVTWLGLWAFYSTNWVAQDYMSDQAVAFTLWLSILATLLTWFTPRPSGLTERVSVRRLARGLTPRSTLSRLGAAGHVSVANWALGWRALQLLLIIAMYGAIVSGHQLTPFPVLLTVIGLILFAQLELRLTPLIMLIVLAAWISYMTVPFISGHHNAVTGSIGHVSQNLTTGIAQRLVGSHDHHVILDVRIIATLGTWLMAAGGLLRRIQARRADVAMVVVAVSPLLLPALQAYGSEVVVRVVLFALPAVSFFIATLAFPSQQAGRGLPTMIAVAAASCLLLAAFQYTRYGDELVDEFTTGDVAAVQALYRVAPPRSTVYGGTANLPWRYRDYADYDYETLTNLSEWNARHPNPARLALELESALAPVGGGYLIVTRSTQLQADLRDDKHGLMQALVATMRSLPNVLELYRNSDGGEVFRIGSLNVSARAAAQLRLRASGQPARPQASHRVQRKPRSRRRPTRR